MSPPPSTPTPRRFLLAKRGTQLSQTPAGTPQFQSTPRFGSSSVPRPTPAWRKERSVEDVEEVEDQVEESDLEDESDADDGSREDEGGDPKGALPLNDPIEVESEGSIESEEANLAIVDDGLETAMPEDSNYRSPEVPEGREARSPIEERESKRRKVSISPVPEFDAADGDEMIEDMASDSQAASPGKDPTPFSGSQESIHEAEALRDDPKALQQPTFHPAPRFKPTETDPTAEGLPAAFSPQRRGAKYLPNGLAAELQGWLSEVKGWEGIDRAPESLMVVTVRRIRPGRRMYLIEGRGEEGGEIKNLMLAGEGKLTGLGRRAILGPGSRVVVGQPVWDVLLEGESWTVACDWSVVGAQE